MNRALRRGIGKLGHGQQDAAAEQSQRAAWAAGVRYAAQLKLLSHMQELYSALGPGSGSSGSTNGDDGNAAGRAGSSGNRGSPTDVAGEHSLPCDPVNLDSTVKVHQPVLDRLEQDG